MPDEATPAPGEVQSEWMVSGWLSLDVINFLDWYIGTAPTAYGYHINGIIKAVKGDIKKSRAVARKVQVACSLQTGLQMFAID